MNVYKKFLVRNSYIEILEKDKKYYISSKDLNMIMARREVASIISIALTLSERGVLSKDIVRAIRVDSIVVRINNQPVRLIPCYEAISLILAIVELGKKFEEEGKKNTDIIFFAAVTKKSIEQLTRQNFFNEFYP